MKPLSWIKNNKEVQNASWLIAGRVVQMVLSFFVSVLTARYLGPNNFGLINYANAYVTFFSSLCTLGINSVIVKEFIDNLDEQGTAIGTTILLRAISSLASAVMIVGIVSLIDHDEPTTIAVAALCSIALLFQIFDTINYWFQSRYQSRITAIVTLVAYVLVSLYKIILLVLGKDVIWFAFANSLDYIVIAIVLYIAYKKEKGPSFTFSWVKAKSILSQSYHYILSGMMIAIYNQTDKLMLKQMLDETSVGYYSLASSLNLVWVFVLQAIIDSLNPTIMRYYKERNITEFEKKNRQLYAIVIYLSFTIAIIFSEFGKAIINLLYGSQYINAFNPLRIITWYTAFAYLGIARNAWIVCEGKQKYLKYMYATAAIINIFINYIFIPKWGASGAAFASLLTQVMTSIILPCFIKDMRPNVKLIMQAFILKGIR